MRLFEYKLYISFCILFIQSMYHDFYRMQVIFCAVGLKNSEPIAPITLNGSYVIHIPFTNTIFFGLSSWQIALLMVVIFYLKYLLNKGVIDMPKNLFVTLAIFPLIFLTVDFIQTIYSLINFSIFNTIYSFGYFYFYLIVQISTFTILHNLKNCYVEIPTHTK